MATMFEQIVLQMQELGFFNFLLPFILTSAVFYGLLRKSEVFGKPQQNVAVNGIIALVASFMVWAFPILQGVDIEAQLSAFFAQGTFVALSLMLGMMLFGMVVPEPSKRLGELFKEGNKVGVIIGAGVVIGIIVFVTSGLFNLIIPRDLVSGISSDVLLTLGLILIAVVPLIFIASGEGGGGGNAGKKPQGGG